MSGRARTDVLGYSVTALTASELGEDVIQAILIGRKRSFLACLNPHSFVEAQKALIVRDALKSATWLIPDGVGIVIASHLLGGAVAGRVTGWDVFLALNSRLNEAGGSVFFIGSTPEVLKAVVERFSRDYPNVRIVGSISPSFATEIAAQENREILQVISDASPDLLWVAMTAPRQEKWIFRNRNNLEVGVAGAIGAVFDFYAGTRPRAPAVWRNLGLEWGYRLLRNPARMWRRTFISAPLFLWAVLKHLCHSIRSRDMK